MSDHYQGDGPPRPRPPRPMRPPPPGHPGMMGPMSQQMMGPPVQHLNMMPNGNGGFQPMMHHTIPPMAIPQQQMNPRPQRPPHPNARHPRPPYPPNNPSSSAHISEQPPRKRLSDIMHELEGVDDDGIPEPELRSSARTPDQLRKERDMLAKQVLQLKKDKAQKQNEFESKRSELLHQVEELRVDNDTLKTQLRETSMEHSKLLNSTTGEEMEADAMRVQILMEQVDALTQEREQLQTTQQELLDRQELLLREKADADEQMNQHQDDLEKRNDQIQQLNHMVELLRQDVRQLESKGRPEAMDAMRLDMERQLRSKLESEIRQNVQRDEAFKSQQQIQERLRAREDELSKRMNEETTRREDVLRQRLEKEFSQREKDTQKRLEEDIRSRIDREVEPRVLEELERRTKSLEESIRRELEPRLELQLERDLTSRLQPQIERQVESRLRHALEMELRSRWEREITERLQQAHEREVQSLERHHDAEIANHEQKLKHLESQNKLLFEEKEQRTAVSKRVSDFEFKLMDVQSERDELARKCQRLEKSLHEKMDLLNHEKYEEQEERSNMTRRLTDLESKLLDRETELADYKRRFERIERSKESEMKELRTDLNNLQSDRDELARESESQLREIKELEQSIAAKNKELDLIKNMKTNASPEIRRASTDNGNSAFLTIQIATLTQERDSMAASYDALQEKLKIRDEQLDALSEKFKESARQITHLERVKSDLEAELANYQSQHDHANETTTRRLSETVNYLNSQHRQEIEELTKSKQELADKIEELALLQEETEDLRSKVSELLFTTSSMQQHIEEKDRVIYQVKQQMQRRLISAETSLQEKNNLINNLAEENRKLLAGESVQAGDGKKGMLAPPASTCPHCTNNGEKPVWKKELELLRQQTSDLKKERDELLEAQQSLLQRQLEQVSERDRLEREIDSMKHRLENTSAKLDTEIHREKGGGWFKRNSTASESAAIASRELLRYKKQLQKMEIEHEHAEAEWKAKAQDLERKLNETMVELDRVMQDNVKLIKDKEGLIQHFDLKVLKAIEEREKIIKEKEEELMHMKRWHYHYGQSRRLFRTNQYPVIQEEDEEEETEQEKEFSMDSKKKSSILKNKKTRQEANKRPESLSERRVSFQVEDEEGRLEKIRRERAYSDPSPVNREEKRLKSDSDKVFESMNSDRINHANLSSDVPTLQSQVRKLLAIIADLRKAILRAQKELVNRRQENQTFKDDVAHLKAVLEQDRSNAHRSIGNWEEWASEVQLQHELHLKQRDEQIEMLKSEFEVAKAEWTKATHGKEVLVLRLLESRKGLVQEIFEEAAKRLNKMQNVMVEVLDEEKQISGGLTAVDLEKRNQDGLISDIFGPAQEVFAQATDRRNEGEASKRNSVASTVSAASDSVALLGASNDLHRDDGRRNSEPIAKESRSVWKFW
jgi:hypothetical protein